MSTDLVPVFYAVAMAVGGAGSLIFGRLFDRFGTRLLLPLTFLSAISAPLAFLGSFGVVFSLIAELAALPLVVVTRCQMATGSVGCLLPARAPAPARGDPTSSFVGR